MSFYQSIRSSLLALFNVSTVELPPAGEGEEPTITTEDIRSAMLDMIGAAAAADDSSPLVRRIRFAVDPQGLWFLRSDLMRQLAHQEGEAMARAKLEMLSDMFRELLPTGLRSRPSPLLSAREERGDSRPHA